MKLKNIRSMMTKVRGFTLLELIVVIAIIGVLSVVVLPNFATALQRARDGRRISELKGLQTNLFLYYQQYGYYPTSYGTTAGITHGWNALVTGGIEERLPTGASLDQATNVATENTVLTTYKYVGIACSDATATGNCAAYQVWTQLESGNTALQQDGDLTATNMATLIPYAPQTSDQGCGNTSGPVAVAGTFSDCAKMPAKQNGVAANQNENCTKRNANAITNTPANADCVFDFIP